MIEVLIYTMAVIVILIAWNKLQKHNKHLRHTVIEKEVDMLRKARIMFPEATDIEALDGLYQFTFRQMLYDQKKGKPIDKLRREIVTIFNVRNKAIAESVRLEQQYMFINNPKRRISYASKN
jgi:hypothetical protein